MKGKNMLRKLSLIGMLIPSLLFAEGWEPVENHCLWPILGISTQPETNALAVGGLGTIMKTTDGTTWTDHSLELFGSFRAVSTLPSGEAVAVGNSGIVYASPNGEEWSPVDVPGNEMWVYYGVLMLDSDHIIAIGQNMDESQALVLATEDGWQTHAIHQFQVEVDGIEQSTSMVDVVLKEEGVLAAVVRLDEEPHGAVLQSSDFGAEWVTQAFTDFSPNAIDFVTPLSGYIACANGIVLRTDNGGENWLPMGTGVEQALQDICFVDPLTGWVCGSNGTILKTTTGGFDWIDQSVGGRVLLAQVEMVSEEVGWVTGDMGTILFTTDGGGTGGGTGNNPPGEFECLSPSGEELVIGEILFVWTTSVDPDGDPIEYRLSIGDPLGEDFYTTDTTMIIDFRDLIEINQPTFVMYQVYASDGTIEITSQGMSPGFTLLPDDTNLQPTEFNLLTPEDEDTLFTTEVTFTWQRSTDPEGEDVSYTLFLDGGEIVYEEIILDDTLCTFDFAPYFTTTGMYPILWRVVASDGIMLRESGISHRLSIAYTPSSTGETENLPSAFQLHRAIPNPFNPSTTIGMSVAVASQVEVEICDVLGRQVRTLLSGDLSAGNHQVVWNGRDDSGRSLTSGVYLIRASATGRDGQQALAYQKVTLLK